MRTVKLSLQTKADAASTVSIETEVVVDDETDAHEAGAEAARFLIDFQSGVIEGAAE